MSKKGGKGVLKRLFSKNDNTEASSSASGAVIEKKKKKVRVGDHRFPFRFVDFILFYFTFSERIGEWPQSPFSPISYEGNILVNVAATPYFLASSIAMRAETSCCTNSAKPVFRSPPIG